MKTVALFPCSVFEEVTLSGKIRKSGREIGKDFLGRTQFRGGFRHLGIDAASGDWRFARFSPNGFLFQGSPCCIVEDSVVQSHESMNWIVQVRLTRPPCCSLRSNNLQKNVTFEA